MAIYYIDPHTTTNGTGTWASPWSLSFSSVRGLSSGDEIRIKGVALTSLLTATSYTATYASYNTLTITAGGGLGADFAAGTFVYLPTYDVFAKVISVATNTLTFSSTAILPWYNTSSGQTAITVRKVNTATYPAGSSTTGTYIATDTVNNITVSDCWTSETTRVTDGSVKTLIYSSSTSTTLSHYLNLGTPSAYVTGNSYALGNTHLLGCSGAAISSANIRSYSSNTTITLKQLYSVGTASVLHLGGAYKVKNVTIAITDLGTYTGINPGVFVADNVTISITRMSSYNSENFFGNSSTAWAGASNVTLNIGDTVGYNNGLSSVVNSSPISCQSIQLNLNGMVDVYTAPTLQYINRSAGGPVEISFGSSFVYYSNRRVSTLTTVSTNSVFVASSQMDCYVPTSVKPSSWSFPATLYNIIANSVPANFAPLFKNKEKPLVVSVPTSTVASGISTYAGSCNLLVQPRDNTDPSEVLIGFNYSAGGVGVASFPVVSTDASTYKTTSPSLKCLLTTYVASLFTNTKPVKTIKIPVTASTSYTVSGYIRSDDTAYANGDCVMSIMKDGTTIASQNMTTACINAWEQFTLTFTPSVTCEVDLVWETGFSNGAKSIWLSDLTIT